ncbi:MAG: cytochrome c biogenesis protein CcdA, partial [Solirubrobacteraceae bacterium]|nr:cytochrome c biogenesis protein CcdA [Solirubrobacteraceae bacterium]
MLGDPTAGIGIAAAMFAGAISFLSPCVLPLVPGYLSAVTGLTPNDLDRAPARRVLLPSLLFVGSFSAVFVLLGVTATGVGSTLRDHRETLEKISGLVIIALGLLFIS